MTDQIPAEKVREIAAAMRAAMRRDEHTYSDAEFLTDMSDYIRDLHALLPAPPSTLTVGSKWDDTAALTRACHESERDQIIAVDSTGDAFVWSWDAEWWEGSAPPKSAPYTIIHTGRETADAVD